MHAAYFIIGEKLPSHAWLEINCVCEPPCLFFPRNSSNYLYLFKIIIRVAFFGNIAKNSQPCTGGDCPLRKFIFLLK